MQSLGGSSMRKVQSDITASKNHRVASVEDVGGIIGQKIYEKQSPSQNSSKQVASRGDQVTSIS